MAAPAYIESAEVVPALLSRHVETAGSDVQAGSHVLSTAWALKAGPRRR